MMHTRSTRTRRPTSAVATPFGVLHNDTDADGDTLTATGCGEFPCGTLTFNPDGSFTYTPRANFNGSDTFTYRASDGVAFSNLATVTINLTSVNDVPIANDDTLTVQNNGPQVIHRAVVVDNDIDPDLTYRATVYSNDFDGLATQPFNAGTNGGPGADGTDWEELPTGWTRDNTSTPAPSSGAAAGAEFFGWHTMDIDSWVSQQGGQQRDFFTKGGPGTHSGVLVADGDAYADFVPIDPNLYTTFMSTPVIPLNGINEDSLQLEFDSSYRPEDPGTELARVYVSFDGGAFQQLSEFNTANTPPGAGSLLRVNDHLVYDLHNAPDAKEVQIKWGYEQTGNDWWWAIDNVKLTGDKTDPAQETIQIQSHRAWQRVRGRRRRGCLHSSPIAYTGPDTSLTHSSTGCRPATPRQ